MLRYARNWMDGLGLVFNAGERVEGFTSPLAVALVSALGLAGVDLLDAARLLGLAATLGLVVTTSWWASRWSPRGSAALLLAPLFVAGNSSLAAWSLAGLEGPLFSLLVLAALAAAWREEARRRTGAGSAILLVLAVFCRPEGILAAAAVGVWKARRALRLPSRRRALATWTVVLGAGCAALELWRFTYYGSWLPNTYYAKTGGGLSQVARGLRYGHDFLLDTGSLFLVALAAAVWLDRRSRPVAALLTAATAALTLGVILEGGDGLPMYRFFLPILAPAGLLAARGLEALLARAADIPRLRRGPRFALGLAAGAGLLALDVDRPRVFPHYENYLAQKTSQVPAWSAAGRWLKAHAPAGASFAAVPIGAVSYYSGLPAIDMLGLTDAHIGRRRLGGLGGGLAGHEKHDAEYVLARRPTFLLLGNINVTREPSGGTIAFGSYSVEWEGDMIRQPDLRRLYRFVSVKLDTGEYLNCLALDGTRFR